MKWPTFIIVGVHKGGTSQLFLNLNKHPDITMCTLFPIEPGKVGGGVEINFWDKKWNKSIDWYRHYFKEKKWANKFEWYKSRFDGDLCGEKSPSTYLNREAFKRMHIHIPDTKLILLLRNPIDRAYSHFQAPHRSNKSADSVFTARSNYVSRGRYFNKIKNNILPYFDKSQLMVAISERMRADPNKELNKIYNFLGVKEINLPIFTTTKWEERFNKRTIMLYEDSKEQQYKVWRNKYAPMNKNIKNQLTEIFKKPNENLFNFLGYKVKEWEK